MSRRNTNIRITTDVDVDMSDFDDDILLDEISYRRIGIHAECEDLITKIWQLRRTGKNYDSVVDNLIYAVFGKVI